MSIERQYTQALRSRGALYVCQNLDYYNSQFTVVAIGPLSFPVLRHVPLFVGHTNQCAFIAHSIPTR